MSIEEVATQLFDNMEEQLISDKKLIIQRLTELRDENNWTNKELNEYCWEDSSRVFDFIYG